MHKHIFLVQLLLLITLNNLFSQALSPIQLDRPDQTECPFITPAKYIQVENGITFEKITVDEQNYLHPTTLWKYGLNEKFEIRLITAFITQKINEHFVSGLMPITIGFKTSICEEKGLIPKVSFIGQLTTASIGSNQFATTYAAPAFRFTMQHSISEKISLAYNVGAEWDGELAATNYLYTFTTGLSLTKKLGTYFELYGSATKNTNTIHNVDCGLTYLINNDCIIDLSGGVGITKNAPQNYVSLGFSYRFNTTQKKKTKT